LPSSGFFNRAAGWSLARVCAGISSYTALSTDVEVIDWKQNERIVIRWSEGETVSLDFDQRGPDQTFVKIENRGFSGGEDEVVAKALDSTCGFTIVLCELKAVLERGTAIGFGPDKFPDARLNVQRRPVNTANAPQR
jgi:hypothetical protein